MSMEEISGTFTSCTRGPKNSSQHFMVYCLCRLLNISPSHFDRRSTQRLTTSSCCMGATSTTPAVPISGLTVWSPNPQASSCLTCSELLATTAMVTRHELIKSSDRCHSRSPRAAQVLKLRLRGVITGSFCIYLCVYFFFILFILKPLSCKL